MARPKRSEQTDLPEAIKATAWKQIGETGAAALSLRAIARDLHITAPAIYNHYPSREALIIVLVTEAFTSFADRLETTRDAFPADDHRARLRAIMWAYHQWAVTYPQRYALIFGTPIYGYKSEHKPNMAVDRSLLLLAGVIEAAYQAGKIQLPRPYATLTPGLKGRYELLSQAGLSHEPVVTQLTLAAWSWIHGLTSLELFGYLPGFLGDQVEEFIRLEAEKFLTNLGLE